MADIDKEAYRHALSAGTLSYDSLNELLTTAPADPLGLFLVDRTRSRCQSAGACT